MTPAKQPAPVPHPQRCETCTKLWKRDCPYYLKIDNNEILGITTESYQDFTAIVGCASHSSAQAGTEAWAIKAPDGELITHRIQDTEARLKASTLGWDIFEKKGYRCVPVRIIEMEAEK